MEGKWRNWINDFLIPFIVDKEKLRLKQSVAVDDVHLKSSKICRCKNADVIFTICHRVEIVLDVNGDERTLAVFVKNLEEIREDLYDMASLDEKFRNEVIAYKKIIPVLNPPVHFPTFLYSHVKRMNAAIAISDFTADGFSMSKSLVNLSLDHILASMKAIGNFHGASFAMKHRSPVEFDTLRNELIDARFKTSPSFAVTLRNAAKRATGFLRKTIDESDVITESFLMDFEKLFCEEADRFLDAKWKVKEPLAVISHGDFLRNNVAFRYDNNGLATEAMLFDLQNVRYGSPMLDLSVFMAISTGYEVRQKNFDEIFRTYYDAVIEQFLNRTNLNADEVLDHMSYDAFLREYTIYLPFAFHITSFFLPQMFEPTENPLEEFKEEKPDYISTRGGEAVDRELKAQIIDMYNFYEMFGLKLLDYQ